MVIIIVVSGDAYYCLIIVLRGERERDREESLQESLGLQGSKVK